MTNTITIVPFFAIFGGGAAKPFPEYTAEIAAGAEAAGVGDLGNGFFAFGEHLAGFLQPIASHIFHRRHVQMILK